jgi:hypothetical protein
LTQRTPSIAKVAIAASNVVSGVMKENPSMVGESR